MTTTNTHETAQISDGARRLNLLFESVPGGIYDLVALFTTQDGSWEPSGKPYGVPQWALRYLPGFSSAGAATHALARVEDADGKPIAVDVEFRAGTLMELVSTASKPEVWANRGINGNYNPEAGEHGPWSMMARGAAQRITGIGLPGNYHVSVFAVWRAIATLPPIEPPKPGYSVINNADISRLIQSIGQQEAVLSSLRQEVSRWLI